eukprot:COSAG05_NODE_1395_length_4993_cov_6.265836_7_plen_61_part_00
MRMDVMGLVVSAAAKLLGRKKRALKPNSPLAAAASVTAAFGVKVQPASVWIPLCSQSSAA